MRLLISGCPKKISLKSVREAAKFFTNHLMSTRLRKGISVRIVFISNFHEMTGNFGDCGPEYSDERPRNFLIRIDSAQSVKSILKTLAHELAHVKSYACGDLKDYLYSNKLKWRGKLFSADDSDESYWLAPWEIEAHGYEYCLYKLFQRYIEDKRKST